ncbi:unnamed protein product [Didymodactylos carnosus]|uniref:5'-nucleotidase n=1 Tax=Didymodactylos carnosus TaxID=1234261 RepID=A0A8S2H860_9BILA|nr:unnamed protein product [Didymodactylos carnosus]CAF3612382.1 unnamed protein product [Didymodactylos carnosus]
MEDSRGQLIPNRDTRSSSVKKFCGSRCCVTILIFIIIGLLISTIILAHRLHSKSSQTQYAVDGTIGFPPRLPNDGPYVQWTFLHMNDVYEMLPLDGGDKGGLSRVARVRQLLLEENQETFTFLAGDLLSPSALSLAKVDNVSLNGRQMVASMNTLGLDFITFGNHEFDLKETDLLQRMNESQFTWISTNVFQLNGQPFSKTIPYKLLTIANNVRILIFGLTIDSSLGPGTAYVQIVNTSSLIPFVQKFLSSLTEKYDVLVALTHLDMTIDIQLVEQIPQIDVILGGHEHEDYYLLRGSHYTPIYKADSNAFSVYIHRCAFNTKTKKFRLYSTLARITPELINEQNTEEVVKYWYDLGVQGFIKMGFEPNKTVATLPLYVELDGRSTSVRNFPTLLTNLSCECMLQATSTNRTIVGLFDSGQIRIDDILRDTVTQYDILRTLPFQNNVFSLSVPGKLLAQVLTHGMSLKGNGMFLVYCGVHTIDQGNTWILNANGGNIATSGLSYNVATIAYAKDATDLKNAIILQELNITQTKVLISYLNSKYPPPISTSTN